MFSRCAFCSASLGTNALLERFPVGRTVAVHAWTGRLWAVCPRCARWNLAPIEERWEAVEDAERIFRDTRRRVQKENIGLASLPDGTRLVRVGAALPGELAAWRWGPALVRRRAGFLGRMLGRLALLDVGLVLLAAERSARRERVLGMGEIEGTSDGGSGQWAVGSDCLRSTARCPPFTPSFPHSPLPPALPIRVADLPRLRVEHDDVSGVRLVLPALDDATRALVVGGDPARRLLGRALVEANETGASRGRVRDATAALEAVGTARAFVAGIAGRTLVGAPGAGAIDPVRRLALEMALHDEEERRALEGDLAQLEAAWREAEEIAAIVEEL